jgi:hypothetical protein
MKSDIRVELMLVEGNVMDLMRQHNIRCRSLASVPLGECWWIWDAEWEGELPPGFHPTTLTHDTPYFKDGHFTGGMSGTSHELPPELRLPCLTEGG